MESSKISNSKYLNFFKESLLNYTFFIKMLDFFRIIAIILL